MAVFNSVPCSNPHSPLETKRTTGFGDTVFVEMLAPTPKLVENWLLGNATDTEGETFEWTRGRI